VSRKDRRKIFDGFDLLYTQEDEDEDREEEEYYYDEKERDDENFCDCSDDDDEYYDNFNADWTWNLRKKFKGSKNEETISLKSSNSISRFIYPEKYRIYRRISMAIGINFFYKILIQK
jgi:hypothetical protein